MDGWYFRDQVKKIIYEEMDKLMMNLDKLQLYDDESMCKSENKKLEEWLIKNEDNQDILDYTPLDNILESIENQNQFYFKTGIEVPIRIMNLCDLYEKLFEEDKELSNLRKNMFDIVSEARAKYEQGIIR